jgi:hypothetical protein
MNAILRGGARVYVPGDSAPPTEGPENKDWGRIIVMPSVMAFRAEEEPHTQRPVGFLVKVEFNNYRAAGYDVNLPIYAAHAEAFDLLDNWAPGMLGVAPNQVWGSFTYRRFPPDPTPLLDDLRSLWVASAEYVAVLAPV